jgi:uncharacterized protein YbaP (TraB family)
MKALKSRLCAVLALALFVLSAECADDLWRVRNGNSTLYLLASVGRLRSADFPLPGSFEQAFTAAEITVFEADYDLAASEEVARYILQKLAFPYPLTIKAVLSTQSYQRLGNIVAGHGYSRDLCDPYRPFLAASWVEDMRGKDIGYLSVFSPGKYFFDRAKTSSKTRLYLETPQAEADNAAMVPDAEFVKYLDDLLWKTDSQLEQDRASGIDIWKAGDLAAANQYYEDLFAKYPSVAQVAARHVEWIPTIEGLLRNGKTTLLICDASHVVGNQGLITLLHNKGYVLTQMPSGQPDELGQTLNGFQDDFNGVARDGHWLPVGGGGDRYRQSGGVLHVSVKEGDPNHLLYVAPGAENAQEVLARIRVVSFSKGPMARAGLGVGVCKEPGPNYSGGINLHFRGTEQDAVGVPHFRLLDDDRAWDSQTLNLDWKPNTWYWMRLRLEPLASGGPNDVFGKVWTADGATPEPPAWQLVWPDSSMPKPLRNGFAGITGSSSWPDVEGLAQFEVDYILIKSLTLPSIKVNFSPVGPTPTPPAFTSIVNSGGATVTLDWFGAGTLQSSATPAGLYQDIAGALPPCLVKIAGPQRYYRLRQ